jgi:hypothetical protein
MPVRPARVAASASLLSLAVLALAGCPRDKKDGDKVPVDTMLTRAMTADTAIPPADLSQLTSNIPAAAPDTFRRKSAADIAKAEGLTTGGSTSRIPDAPAALMETVQREVSFQRFCYQEFGQKADPTLAGNVAMIVTVSSSGISGAEVGNSRWTSNTGRAVNQCLSQKAKQAWKLEPGSVKPGRYVVQLSFRGT